MVSCNFGNLFVNKYGFPIVSVSEDLEDPKIEARYDFFIIDLEIFREKDG